MAVLILTAYTTSINKVQCKQSVIYLVMFNVFDL